MANIQDHARQTGGRPLGEKPFDALDGLILTQLVYMPMEGLMDGPDARPTVAQAWAFLKAHVDYEALDVFQQKRYRLFETCAGLERYAAWRMRDYVNEIDPQGRCSFARVRGNCPTGGAMRPFAARI